LPESVSANPACLTSETSVVNWPAATAVSTIVDGAVAGAAGMACAGAAAMAPTLSAATRVRAPRRRVRLVRMVFLSGGQ